MNVFYIGVSQFETTPGAANVAPCRVEWCYDRAARRVIGAGRSALTSSRGINYKKKLAMTMSTEYKRA